MTDIETINYFNLIPNELVCEIGKYLDDLSLINFSLTCNRMVYVLSYIIIKRNLQCYSIIHLTYHNKINLIIDLIENYYTIGYDRENNLWYDFDGDVEVEEYEDHFLCYNFEIRDISNISYLFAICVANDYKELNDYFLENLSEDDMLMIDGNIRYNNVFDIGCRYRNHEIIMSILNSDNHEIDFPPFGCSIYLYSYLDKIDVLNSVFPKPKDFYLESFLNIKLNTNSYELNIEFLDLLITGVTSEIRNRRNLKIGENLIKIFLSNFLVQDLCHYILDRLQIYPNIIDEKDAILYLISIFKNDIIPFNTNFYITWLSLTKNKVLQYSPEFSNSEYFDLFLDN